MLISGKGKCFHGVWLHFKKFSGKYFLVFGKEEGKHKFRKTQATTQIAPSDDRDPRSQSTARSRSRLLREIVIDGAISRSVDGDLDLVWSRLREIASTAISIRCDLAKARSQSRSSRKIRCDRDLDPVARSGAIAISIWSRDPVRSQSRARSVSLSLLHFPEILWRENRSVKTIPWSKAFFFGQRISISGK